MTLVCHNDGAPLNEEEAVAFEFLLELFKLISIPANDDLEKVVLPSLIPPPKDETLVQLKVGALALRSHREWLTPQMQRRYLVAHAWKPQVAFEKLLLTLRFRCENIPQKWPLDGEMFAQCAQTRFLEWHGFDREGRPCIYLTARFADLSIEREHRTQYVIFMMEKGIALMNRQNSKTNPNFPIEQWNVIVDETDKTWSHTDNTWASSVGSILFNHYVERMRKTYIINAGILTSAAIAVAKLIIDERTSNKMVNLSAERLGKRGSPTTASPTETGTPSKCKEVLMTCPELVEMLGEQAVPERLGGQLKIPGLCAYRDWLFEAA